MQGWARKVHRPLHITLMWGLLGVAMTGFFAGFDKFRATLGGGYRTDSLSHGLAQAERSGGHRAFHRVLRNCGFGGCPCGISHLAAHKTARQCVAHYGAKGISPLSVADGIY